MEVQRGKWKIIFQIPKIIAMKENLEIKSAKSTSLNLNINLYYNQCNYKNYWPKKWAKSKLKIDRHKFVDMWCIDSCLVYVFYILSIYYTADNIQNYHLPHNGIIFLMSCHQHVTNLSQFLASSKYSCHEFQWILQ